MSRATLTPSRPLDYAAPARRGQSLRYGVWAIGVVVIGGMLVSVLLPSLCRSSETANRIKCASSLRQIGQAIGMYAQSHGGQYPPSLAVLLSVEDITAELMICPSSSDERSAATDTAGVVAELSAAETNAPGHKHCMSYVYTGQALTQSTATNTSVVAYERLTNHDDEGTNVLYGDGHVDWETEKSWSKIAAEAGIAITPRPGK